MPSLTTTFPNLANYSETSPQTVDYNCVAWAAGEDDRWWWPSGLDYWPPGVALEVTLDAFSEAFQVLGYVECPDGDHESDSEKVAIYADVGVPKHMARQNSDGSWTSKLGQSVDIAHGGLVELEGTEYGSVVRYLARPRGSSGIPQQAP